MVRTVHEWLANIRSQGVKLIDQEVSHELVNAAYLYMNIQPLDDTSHMEWLTLPDGEILPILVATR